MAPARGDAGDSPFRLAAVHAELNVVAALVAAAPSLNPSRSARSRMRLHLLGALRAGPDRSTPTGRERRRMSIAF